MLLGQAWGLNPQYSESRDPPRPPKFSAAGSPEEPVRSQHSLINNHALRRQSPAIVAPIVLDAPAQTEIRAELIIRIGVARRAAGARAPAGINHEGGRGMCAHQHTRQRNGADDGEKPHGGAPIEGIHSSASAAGIPLQARNASRKSPRQSP